MNRLRLDLVTLLLASAVSLPAGVDAQVPSTPQPAPPGIEQPRIDEYELRYWRRPVLRIGLDYTLDAGSAVREVYVVFGDATIEGRVDQDVVVAFGTARLASTANIDGSLVVIGGPATVAAGARVGDDLVVVGGEFEAPPGFSPRGEHIIVGTTALGDSVHAVIPWVTRGLLWGRPIVPDLPWVWAVAGVFFLVYLALNVMFDHPIRACAATLVEKPLTAFVVGLLVLLLTGPVSVLMAVSIIGLAVVPFVLCALFVAGIVGKVSVARWIGMTLVQQESPDNRLQSLRSFIVGSIVITLAYMVPLLGFVTWTLLGVMGIGAAALTFISAYRRENPLRVRRGPPSAPPVVAPGVAAGVPPSDEPPARPDPEVVHRSSSVVDPSVWAFTPPPPPITPAMVSDLPSYPHAAFADRAVAFVLDVILVMIAQEILDLTRRDSAIFVLLLAYHIGFWTWKGTTVGGIICQLRVVRIDGAPLRFVDAFVRGLAAIFSLAVVGLGCFWIIRDPERQAWHDKIAGTYVIKVPKNFPL